MKKLFRVLLPVLLLLALLFAAGCFLLRHFVTDQIMDRGGMENPEAGEATQLLPGEDADDLRKEQ